MGVTAYSQAGSPLRKPWCCTEADRNREKKFKEKLDRYFLSHPRTAGQSLLEVGVRLLVSEKKLPNWSDSPLELPKTDFLLSKLLVVTDPNKYKAAFSSVTVRFTETICLILWRGHSV